MIFFFFFNDTATTEIYTLSLHDALPIFHDLVPDGVQHTEGERESEAQDPAEVPHRCAARSEEHTSELQSRLHLVCRLLLEKKKNNNIRLTIHTLNALSSIHSNMILTIHL